MSRFAAAAGVITLILATGAHAQFSPEIPVGTATLLDTAGKRIGTVTFAQSTGNGVHVTARVEGAPPGSHAMHIHERAACKPNFEAAGGHYNPGGARHGARNDPHHAGDLPTLHIPPEGRMMTEFYTTAFSVSAIKGSTALVLHENPNDYMTDPSGNSGARIACGEIR